MAIAVVVLRAHISFDAAMVQVIFIGLAALTVPHMMLADGAFRRKLNVDTPTETFCKVNRTNWANRIVMTKPLTAKMLILILPVGLAQTAHGNGFDRMVTMPFQNVILTGFKLLFGSSPHHAADDWRHDGRN